MRISRAVTVAAMAVAAMALQATSPPVARAEESERPSTQFYGFVLLNALWSTNTTLSNDVPLLVTGEADGALFATARQSRLGVKGGKRLGGGDGLDGGYKLEIDFYGGFPGVGLNESFPLPRLRIATISVGGTSWKLTAGQDWLIFAPLLPDTLSHQAVPGWAGAGNLWGRHFQLQGSVTRGPITAAAALLAPVDGEPAGGFSFAPVPGPGERTGLPAAEARVAFARKLGGAASKPSTLALSGHVGRERYPLEDGSDAEITVWGASADLTLELPRVTLLAEGFVGEDLGVFMGGALQGVRRSAGADPMGPPAAVAPIATRGGWVQVIAGVGGGVRVAAGYGLDDPDNDDVAAGGRVRNQAGYGTVFWRRGEVETALELEWIRTDVKGGGDLDALSVNASGIYRF